MNLTILRFDSLDSTNTEALNQARRGADEGLCVVARRQTAGRGRHGRVWISEKDAGLYFSLVLRPKIENKFLPLITLMTAVAVFDVLTELYELKPDIKWANDVHVFDKKISGILAEMTETPKGSAIIVGIGINLKSSNFPPELKDSATSIEAETGAAPNVEKLLESLTEKLAYFYQMLENDGGAGKIRREWAARSSYFADKRVSVKLANESFAGTTRGIEENGALRVETDDGEIKIVQAGDVERLRKV
ncbi:MAG: biotin--[acetyl-CoA-carboxylase] ligase [Pyrinomonadaceae bacterium]|nr:biotin--[acetyl-CoA-carboxylase] ligase [Pyrinomonadaceae bacterium]